MLGTWRGCIDQDRMMGPGGGGAALKAASCPPGPGRQAGGRAGAGVRRAAGALCHVPGLLRTCGHWAGAVLKSVLGEHRGQVGLLSI